MPKKDLNDIYEEQATENMLGNEDEVNPFPDTPGGTFNPFSSSAPVTSRDYDTRKYVDYLHAPVYENQGDINLRRGEGQSGWEKFGNFGMQTLGKFTTQLLDMAGGIGSLATQWGDNKDYKNGFTEATDAGNAWLEENFPLYRSTQGTFGLTDASWWLSNAAGLAASMGSFAVGGFGVAKLIGAIGKATKLGVGLESVLTSDVLGFLKSDAIAAKAIAQAGERTLAAGSLAYLEGAMSGRHVYDQVYAAQIAQGASEEEAVHMASQSAASTVQLSTLLNTGTNMLGGMNMFFNHEKNAVVNTAKQVLKQMDGEKLPQYLNRLATENANKYARELGTDMGLMGMGKKGLTAGREAIGEGIEEVNTMFAEVTGVEEGKKGKIHGLVDQFGQLSNYLDRTMNEEGALNFILGAVAGPAQNTLTTLIPAHKVETGPRTNADGQLLDAQDNVVTDISKAAQNYEWMNSIKKNRSMTDKFFTNIRDKVVEDATFLMETEEAIKKALADGNPLEAEKLKNDYFNIMNLNSVALGMTDNLKETYRSIAGLDNTKTDTAELEEKIGVAEAVLNRKTEAGEDVTEDQIALTELQDELAKSKNQTAAMKLGFTNSTEDNSYKEKAEKAIKSLEAQQAIHDRVYSKYGLDKDRTDLEQTHIADHIFKRESTLQHNREYLSELEAELVKIDEEVAGIDIDSDKAAMERRQKATARQREGLFNHLQSVTEEIKKFNDFVINPNDPNALEAALPVLNSYGGVHNGANLEQAMKKISDRLKERKATLEAEADALIAAGLDSDEYKAWVEKNPGKSYQAYQHFIAKAYASSEIRQKYQEAIAATKDRIQIQAEGLNELTNAQTMNKMMKNVKDYFKELKKKSEQEAADRMAKVKELQKDQAAQQKAKENELKKARGKYRQEMANIQQKLPQLRARLAEVLDKLEKQTTTTDNLDYYEKRQVLNNEKNSLGEEILNLTDRFKILETLYYTTHPAAAAPIAPTAPFIPPPIAHASPDSTPEPLAAITATVVETPALDAFNAALSGLTNKNKKIVYEEMRAVKKGKKWSLNSLSNVPNGAKIMQLMKETLLEEKVAFEEVEAIIAEADEVIDSELPEESTVPVAEGEVPVFGVPADLSEIDATLAEMGIEETWEGIKQKYPSNSLAALSLQYHVIKQGEVFKKLNTELINEDVDISVLMPKGLPPGTELRLVVDVDYNGDINDANFQPTSKKSETRQRNSKFKDFTTEDGKILMDKDNEQVEKLRKQRAEELRDLSPLRDEIKDAKAKKKDEEKKFGAARKGTRKKLASLEAKLATATQKVKNKFEKLINIENLKTEELRDLTANNFSNVPIKIVTEDGKTVAWLHRNEWIMEKVDGTVEEYRNVTDEIDGVKGNALAQSMALLALRRAVVEQFNAGNTEGLTTRVTSKGPGLFIYMKKLEKASDHLKGEGISLAYVKDSNTLTQTNVTDVNAPPSGTWKGWENRVVALVPMANGSHSAVPLIGDTLLKTNDLSKIEEGDDVWHTVNRVIQLHINQNKAEIDELKAATGFDVSTKEGFREFMMQYYTYFTPAKNFLESDKTGYIIDSIGTVAGKPTIKIIHKTALQHTETAIELGPDGQLTTASQQALANLLSTRYKSPAFSKGKIKGLNSNEVFKYSIFYKGKWIHNQTDNYNRYFLAHVKTNVTFAKNPKNKTSSMKYKDSADRDRTEYFYGVSPIISFNAEQVLSQNVKEEFTLEDGKVEATTAVEEVIPNFQIDDFGSANPIVKSVGTTDKPAISLQSLETLFTFTPLDDRNGSTPQERLDYYRSIGVTHLPENYNPFKKCK